jgi:coenzyme F420-reducing hydrogenase beta subunit
MIDCIEKIDLLQKSKYVQSDVRRTYEEARDKLENGYWVLYSGTPCQVNALKRYLGKEYDNLYLVDVICAGVPSPGVWKSYISEINANYGENAKQYIFREKEFDDNVLKPKMRNLTIKMKFESGKVVYQNSDSNVFFKGFLEKLFLRPACHSCQYKGFKSGSDIQLGDFWEIERVYPEAMDITDKQEKIPFGVSEVIVVSEKGERLFERAKDSLEWFKANTPDVICAQKDRNWYLVENSAVSHWNRKSFFEDYYKDPSKTIEAISNNLNIRNGESFKGKNVGMWGSYNLRASLRMLETYHGCILKFQFRNSTIVSAMSDEWQDGFDNIKMSTNSVRADMQLKDMRKDFIKGASRLAENVDIFIFDLLEERYRIMRHSNTFVTKSEGYYDSIGISGTPYEESFDDWTLAIERFISELDTLISEHRAIMIENYLCEKHGEKLASVKYEFLNHNQIDSINDMLERKYRYIKEHWPNLIVVEKLPDIFYFTDTNHKYGCVPEHMNNSAYKYMAQLICTAYKTSIR